MNDKLTANMRGVLKRMYENPDHQAFVHMSTATALLGKELVQLVRRGNTYRTEGGTFPHEKVELTKAGMAYCRARFKERGE